MAKKNESLGEKILRYGKAYLFEGGVFGVGKEAINDYKAHQEEQSWVDEMLSRMDDAFGKEDYEGVIKIADLIIDEENMDKDALRIAVWYKAKSCLLYAIDEDDVQSQNEALNNAENLFFDYGNEYGWDEDVIYMLMIVYECSGRTIASRNAAICLMNSDDRDIRTKALNLYSETTDVLMEHRFTKELSYSKRKYIFIGQNVNKIGGTYQWYDDERVIDWIFTLDQRPKDIVFPLGRPQPGLYMAHPVKTEQYYPMKGVEETLFMEKVREFCWFVQCLGATRVSFHSNKGLSVSQGMGSTMNTEAQIGVKSVNVGGGYGNTRKQDDAYSSNQQVELIQNFAPKKKAYCPDDLIWLDSDPAWQMLLKQRLEGGIMEYTYKISSSETCQMSTNEMESVKANFEYMMIKANGSYDVSRDQTFSNNEETEWSIHVEFAPIESLNNNVQPEIINSSHYVNEKMNANAVMNIVNKNKLFFREFTRNYDFCFFLLDKDSYSDVEENIKSILETFPLGKEEIPLYLCGYFFDESDENSESRWFLITNTSIYCDSYEDVFDWNQVIDITIENNLLCLYFEDEGVSYKWELASEWLTGYSNTQLEQWKKILLSFVEVYKSDVPEKTSNPPTGITDSEQEYLDIMKECFEDGEIGSRERKLLDKIRIKNGISEERAKELESTLTVPQLTEDETEYLEMYHEYAEKGEITEKERRRLDKFALALGLTQKRIEELESNF